MRAKIEKFLSYFELFGAYYKVANSTKRDLIAKQFFAVAWLVPSIFFIFQGIQRGLNSNNFSSVEYICQYVSHIMVQYVGLIIIFYCIKHRKGDHEIIENFTEIHDLIEKSLGIKIPYKRFYREAVVRIAVQSAILFGSVVFRFFNESEIYLYKNYEVPEPFVGLILGRMFIVKFLFYIDLMYFYLKIIEENFNRITDKSHNIYILQRIHKNIWQSSRCFNKYFSWQIVCSCMAIITTVLYHGLLLASKLARGAIKWTQAPFTFTPIYSFIMMVQSCSRCIDAATSLRALLVRKTHEKHIQDSKLVEHYSMQMDHQKIEFHPMQMLTFNYEFIVAVLCFIIDYDIVFMQFYFT